MELIISLVKWDKAKYHISFLMLRMRGRACTFESRDHDGLGQWNVSRNIHGNPVVDCKSSVHHEVRMHNPPISYLV
jgi:hypothetical protein